MILNIWDLFVDLGLISILLLIGILLRAKVTLIQKFFLPASIIAGLLGLILGPNGYGILPFTNFIGQYPGILIAMIFGSIPLISPRIDFRIIKDRVGGMFSYSAIIVLLQWGLGLLFVLLLLNPFWKNLPEGFGLVLASGFVGGHGTAAAVGDFFANSGRGEEIRSLAMTSATIGILCSVFLGILLIKSGANKGEAKFISSFSSLPDSLRTGLISKNERKPSEINTFSSVAVDPLIVHIALICFIVFCAFLITKGVSKINSSFTLPIFSVAFLVGLFVVKIMNITKASEYISQPIVERVNGSATDLLVAFGISSINLSVVVNNIVPLILLLGFGVIYCYIFYKIISKKFFKTFVFEKAIFTWGWATGTAAMGIALLRITDPDNKSGTLEDYGLAYILNAPIEILLVTFAPMLVVMGFSYLFVGITFAAVVIIYLISKKLNWLVEH